jgi:hypothetical protein
VAGENYEWNETAWGYGHIQTVDPLLAYLPILEEQILNAFKVSWHPSNVRLAYSY